ncbi:hypothetical protein PNO24_08330 [Gemella haemolysans]|uniref:hypothetical protein n=1 Tax=Gemella haemolysans TaxID=1379 RepID=UPI00232C8A17|nr:hypothetical protein [Gemella haemolysans]MDB6213916.1 hypothetical protein [Gemella haemolysans]
MVNWKKWFLEEDEDEIFEEEISRKEKKESSLETRERRTENKRKERVYYEDGEDFEIDFSSRKSKRTFEEDEFESDFGNRRKREKTQEKFEDYEEVNLEDFEIDKFEDDDYEEDFEQERKSKKETGFFTKFKNLFKQNDEELDDDFLDEELLEEDKDDEAEDYKTYLERQKREQKEKAKLAKKEQSRVVKEEDFEDYEDEEEYEEDKKVGFFSRLKDKLFNVSEDEIDQEELEAVLDDYEKEEYEEETPVKKKPQVSVERFDSEPEEELEIEFVDEVKEEAKFEEIDITKYEEKEEKASAGTVTDLGDALKKLGVTNSEITDVDIFDEKPTRRKHPTLAAVRTKRLKQDHKIDELGDSVVLGKDNSELKQEVATSFKGQTQEETQVQEERVTKNKEARKEFEENFNSLERRSDKIEKDNPLYVKKNEKLDGIFDEIREKESKTHEKEAPALEVRELDAEGSRREKLKYTSVHDVLEGNEDLFEDDIDRVSKKLVGERFEESQESSEEVENFRKGLYEGKKSENTQERTALDELIKTENIDVSPRKEETLPEIEELNENLADLKKEKQEETYVDLVQEAAKIEDIEVEDYEEIKEVKKDRLSGYSDYHLNEDEIEELEEQNYLEESADSVNIDSLIREVSPNNKIIKKANDVDKFTDEKVVPKEVVEKRVEDAKAHEESEQVEEVERGIDYTEKLYTNDVSEYFDKGNGTKLGEYKTVDYGYRPVSKEKIENNQKILDAIFEKYSSSGISTSTKSVTSQMMSSNTITPKSRSVGKFKPSPVYSSVYGSATRNTAENSNKPVGISTTGLSINNQVSKTTPEVKKNEPKLVEKKAVEAEAATEISNANIYKEIASQEETVWNIGSAKRVPKNKVKNKK